MNGSDKPNDYSGLLTPFNGSYDEDEDVSVNMTISTPSHAINELGATGLHITKLAVRPAQIPSNQNGHVAVMEAIMETADAKIEMTGAASPADLRGDTEVERLMNRAAHKALYKAVQTAMYVQVDKYLQEQHCKEEDKENSKTIDCQTVTRQSSGEKAVQPKPDQSFSESPNEIDNRQKRKAKNQHEKG